MKKYRHPELEIIQCDISIDVITGSPTGSNSSSSGSTNSDGEVETPWDFD